MNSYSQSKDLYNIGREESCNYTCLMCNVYYLSAMSKMSFVFRWCTLHCLCVPGFRSERADALRIDVWEYVSCFWSALLTLIIQMACVCGLGVRLTYVSVPHCAPLLIHETAARRCAEMNWGVTGLVPAMAAKVSINRRVLEHDNEPGSLTCCKSDWIRASLNPQSVNGAGLPSGISPSLYVPFWWTF